MAQDDFQPINRAAYSPAEFAAACGRHPTWSYRLLYSGKIHAITQLGRILIPASELQRILSFAQRYNPKPKLKAKSTRATEHEEAGQPS
jgi:Helix-turn-helix domain